MPFFNYIFTLCYILYKNTNTINIIIIYSRKDVFYVWII